MHQPPDNLKSRLRVCPCSNRHSVNDDVQHHKRCSHALPPSAIATSMISTKTSAATTTSITCAIDRNASGVQSVPDSSTVDSDNVHHILHTMVRAGMVTCA
ncbi:hypothetical protein SprV_0702307100 [Sparganum proliferum]